jgi:hypothetical protein
VFLMPWMVPARIASTRRPLPVSPAAVFWAIAVLTIIFAWPVRYEPNRGYRVLTVSLLLVAAFFMTLR